MQWMNEPIVSDNLIDNDEILFLQSKKGIESTIFIGGLSDDSSIGK